MVSDFTRQICRRLCAEKAVAMEIERLERKREILKQRPLTLSEVDRDEYERAEADRLMRIAQEPEGGS